MKRCLLIFKKFLFFSDFTCGMLAPNQWLLRSETAVTYLSHNWYLSRLCLVMVHTVGEYICVHLSYSFHPICECVSHKADFLTDWIWDSSSSPGRHTGDSRNESVWKHRLFTSRLLLLLAQFITKIIFLLWETALVHCVSIQLPYTHCEQCYNSTAALNNAIVYSFIYFSSIVHFICHPF